MKKSEAGLLWVPFDLGTKLIRGRPGSRFGPEKIKKEFQKLKHNVVDYGNIVPVKNNVKKTHEKVTKAVKKIIKDGLVPIVVGGSHDNSFGSSKALSLIFKKIGQINIDAHYDVRPVVNGKITSGTPFRRLIEGKFLNGKNFVELGAHSPKNQIEHFKYLKKQKATVIKLQHIKKTSIAKSLKRAFHIAAKNTNAVAFDIDIDSVEKKFAPGCSAPCIVGFTKKQILESAFIAGKNKDIKLFNLMEVNPLYDVNNKTVKLGARLILNFIKGLEKRQ